MQSQNPDPFPIHTIHTSKMTRIKLSSSKDYIVSYRVYSFWTISIRNNGILYI